MRLDICSINGCGQKTLARGFCRKHYLRFWKHGDPLYRQPGYAERGQPLQWLKANLGQQSDACLLWPFSKNNHGYGRVYCEGKVRLAHRLVCELVSGPPPTPGHEAAHLCGCGHLGCVNPRHLAWKTALENAADTRRHGTLARGERHGMARLTEADVRSIRSNSGIAHQDICEKYGVSKKHIDGIRSKKSWAWLK